MIRSVFKLVFPILILAFVLTGALSACGLQTSPGSRNLVMVSLDGMPMDVQSAPVSVQQAYQFNVANPDVMTQIPCYCGCGAMGHTSNYSCYVSEVDAGGNITYDTHALGCSICVDITQDTMRLLRQGRAVPEIKSYIDQTYAQFGPSNMP